MTAEQQRLTENAVKEIPLEKWGPYLSERQWGTVREDYSEGGDAWNYFPHDHARSRAYRWGEDGLAGITDYGQQLCFAVALWNGKDPILKERLFGLTNGEGNHGEDVKELYYYLDNVPTHYYMKYLYKYPQLAFPYADLVTTNRQRSKLDPEYEILDTGVFNDNRYFDVFVEYAKQDSEDIFIRIEIVNRGKEAAPITVLPTLWFFNGWQFNVGQQKPSLHYIDPQTISVLHEKLGDYYFYFLQAGSVLFTENETNEQKITGRPNQTPFVKDAFHEAVIHGENRDLLRNKKQGTKCSPLYEYHIGGGSSQQLFLRLTRKQTATPFAENFEHIFQLRKQEADAFYQSILPPGVTADMASVQRQAFAGLLWSRQYYHYDVDRWLHTSDGITAVTPSRLNGRNAEWTYLKNKDILSMPDKWEYPWYASWDLAFHCIPMAIIDPVFAKNQLTILMREWYMNPAGQIPAYEWNFSDVNPPVHAFAALQVYHIEKERTGMGDIRFLKRMFQKLIINFTWWTNRKDNNGNNIFEGGFLGLDNIGVFNRSTQLPNEIELEQTDGTSWMGMYALNMMDMALEIAAVDDAFEDTATKFYEHFVLIAEALNGLGLWDKNDQFFYDVLCLYGQQPLSLKIRSVVGLIPLFAVSVIPKTTLDKLPDFKKRLDWFIQYRSDNHQFITNKVNDADENILFSLVDEGKLKKLAERMLDEQEFLSAGGIRALSKYYKDNPYSIEIEGTVYQVTYDPGDSTSSLFGGNSNWRGPVWMPINYLLVKAIEKYGKFYGNRIKVEYPKGSGVFLNLADTADELRKRLVSIFLKDAGNERRVHGPYNWFYKQAGNEELLLFYEYFHGDTAHGVGASHQTGWTALIAEAIGYV
ncbi:MAG: glucosidase [Chitinophagaceae bacterium]